MSEQMIESGQLGLGYVFGQENPQHYEGMLRDVVFTAPPSRPLSVDHRGWLWVENQGQLGSCAGHALALVAAVCCYIATRGQVRQRMSRMWCYLEGQKQGGFFGRDQGASISGCAAAAKQNGIAREETFPYTGVYSTQIPQAAVVEAGQHRILSATPLRDYAGSLNFISMGLGGIQIGINWLTGLANNRTGLITRDNCGGRNLGGHSLAILGYSERMDDQGRNWLIMHNSHDYSWGKNGCAEVEPAVYENWIRNASPGEFMALSDMQEYQNRFVDVSQVA